MTIVLRALMYSLLTMLAATYLGLQPTSVIPDALSSADAEIGSPLMEWLVAIHESGQEHRDRLLSLVWLTEPSD